MAALMETETFQEHVVEVTEWRLPPAPLNILPSLAWAHHPLERFPAKHQQIFNFQRAQFSGSVVIYVVIRRLGLN